MQRAPYLTTFNDKFSYELKVDIYCEQLQKLSNTIAQKCPELINRKSVVFHHDNARPHKFGHSAKIVATWLESVTTSIV